MPTVHQMTRAAIFAIFLCGSLRAESLERDTWPQWRGPMRDGHVQGEPWPNSLSNNLTADWSVQQGPSYSGPIVANDRVFVTETKQQTYEVVRALNRKSGNVIWETQWAGSLSVPFFAAANGSWIRATPAYDGQRLFVAGIRDVVVCLDATSGAILWRRDFVRETGSALPRFGTASSPLIHGDHVFIQAGASLTKLNKFTGETVWQTLRDRGGMQGGAFSSPALATIADVPQLVVQTRTTLAGVDVETGSVLWSEEIPAFRGMNILTPTVIGDAVFTSSYGGRSTLFRISRSEREWSVRQAWSHRAQGYMSSPVVIDDHIFLHLRNQRLVCLDAQTGAARWTTKPFGKYWSIVANGDRLLALDQRGELLLIDSSPDEFRLIDRLQVATDSWAHLAIVNSQIFVRDLEAIKAFTWR